MEYSVIQITKLQEILIRLNRVEKIFITCNARSSTDQQHLSIEQFSKFKKTDTLFLLLH